MNLPFGWTVRCQKSGGERAALQTLREVSRPWKGAKRLEWGAFTAAFSRRIVTAVSIFAFAIAAVADEPTFKPVSDARPILQDLQRKMASVESVYLEFTQERQLKLFSEPLKSEGVMLIKKPDQIRWETTAPYQSILLGNKKSVAQFERNDGKWEKLKLGFPQMLKRVMDQMTLMHQGNLEALTSDFTVNVSTGKVAIITMIPKDKEVRSMLASLEIRMKPDFSATTEVVMNEPGGDLTRIIFRREKRNATIPPGAFDQIKPLDVAAIKAAVGHEP